MMSWDSLGLAFFIYGSGIVLFTAQLILLILNTFNQIDWPWYYVWAPVGWPFAALLAFAIVANLFGCVYWVFCKITNREFNW